MRKKLHYIYDYFSNYIVLRIFFNFFIIFRKVTSFECKTRVLGRNNDVREKNDEFSFSVKLISKLVCLTNVVVLVTTFFSFDSRQWYWIFKFL